MGRRGAAWGQAACRAADTAPEALSPRIRTICRHRQPFALSHGKAFSVDTILPLPRLVLGILDKTGMHPLWKLK